jgi:hypothetical protein
MLAEETLRALSAQTELLTRAARWPGPPRERLVALGEAEELAFRLYPYHYRALQLTRVASQFSKLAAPRGDRLHPCESKLMALIMEVLGAAVRSGDLQLTGTLRPAELAFVLWALAFGTRALMDTRVAVAQLGVSDGAHTARVAVDLLLDSLAWQPLSTYWDYDATRRRIRSELFAAEWLRLDAAAENRNGPPDGDTTRR